MNSTYEVIYSNSSMGGNTMKKVINRKLYDTKTATEVGWWCNGLEQRDFECVKETLYRKRTGEYFLHGIGGGLTQYTEFYNGASTSGAKIIPLTYDMARDWAEKKLSGDEYIQEFGEPEEDDGGDKIAMTITITKAKAAAIRKAAQKAGISAGQFISENLSL